MMGKSVFFSEGTAGQMKSAPSFAKDDDSTLPKEPNGSKIGLGPKPIWGVSVNLLQPPIDIGVTYCDDRDGNPDADPGNVREPGLGAKRRYRHFEGRTGTL